MQAHDGEGCAAKLRAGEISGELLLDLEVPLLCVAERSIGVGRDDTLPLKTESLDGSWPIGGTSPVGNGSPKVAAGYKLVVPPMEDTMVVEAALTGDWKGERL